MKKEEENALRGVISTLQMVMDGSLAGTIETNRDSRLDPTKRMTYVVFRNRIRNVYGDASIYFIHVAEAIKLNPNISKDEVELLIGNLYEGIRCFKSILKDKIQEERVII